MQVSDSILEALPNLGPEQLREVAARASFLLNPTAARVSLAPASSTEDGDGDLADQGLVAAEIELVLRRLGNRRPPPLTVILQSKYASAFRDGVARVIDFARAELRAGNRAEELKAVRLILDLARRDLQERRIPVGPKTLSEQLRRVDQVVECYFPGYAEAGLLPIILRHTRQRREVSASH